MTHTGVDYFCCNRARGAAEDALDIAPVAVGERLRAFRRAHSRADGARAAERAAGGVVRAPLLP